MRSPAEMQVIQIELTNACPHLCANCTRFCGHHKKPFFMDLAAFRKAVDSLEGFGGIVGVMGGEPTLNPDFDRIVEYYASKVPAVMKFPAFRQPMRSFTGYAARKLAMNLPFRRGLWTSLGGGYYRHFERIQDTFPLQFINDHSSAGLHQALLMPRGELGIPDEVWFPLRDKCWIQNEWSASITPKGAFFCEVAAALDMLFDGPGGWPVEPGWWKRRPEEFGDQLRWCEYCSAPLNVPRLPANGGVDAVTPGILKKLESVGSFKAKLGRVHVFDPAGYDVRDAAPGSHAGDWYLPGADKGKERVSDVNSSLYCRRIDVVGPPGAEAALARELGKLPEAERCKFAVVDAETAEKLEFYDWLLWCRSAKVVRADFLSNLTRTIFNPGCLYVLSFGRLLPGMPKLGRCAFALFNRRASALENARTVELEKLAELYRPEKRVRLHAFPDLTSRTLGRKLADIRDDWPRLRHTPLRAMLRRLMGK